MSCYYCLRLALYTHLFTLSNSFNIIFSVFKVAECSSTYGNPSAKKARLDLSNYKEVDKENDLSESNDLDSDKVNPEIDDESKYNDKGDDDENIVSRIYP